MILEQLVEKFSKNPSYYGTGAGKLAKKFKCDKQLIYDAKAILIGQKSTISKKTTNPTRSTPKVSKNVLIIADTHLPYEKEGYLEFCIEQYKKYNCDTVIHIGDLIDAHTTSRHPSLPDAYSPGDELNYSIKKLKRWYEAFPKMKVCIGNHDMRAHRAAVDGRIASKWVRDYNEVLEVPNWEFEEYFEIDDVVYTHGTGTTGITAAYKRAMNAGKSVVMGHLHSEANIIYHKFENKTVFGMIVGCGVDENSYGMNYAKNYPKKSIISCGIISGGQPMIRIMQ